MPLPPRLFAAPLAALAVLLLSLPVSAASEHRYTISFSGHVGGQQITSVADDGTITSELSYRENGRGPDYHEVIVTGADDLPQRFAITGTSTFGSKVDERFERSGDTATWAGAVDRGSAAVTGKALYVPIESTLEMATLTLKALIREPSHTLPGLPGGSVRAVKLEDAQVNSGGAPRTVSLWAVFGIDLQPSYTWMSGDGDRVFAQIYPGAVQILLTGWERDGDALEKRQVAAQDAYQREVATRNRHALPQPLLIKNARVFDAERAVLLGPRDVYVNRGRIAAIYETGSTPREAASVVDAKGMTLLPGLFDMHAHVGPGDYLLNLAAGVTTVRDLGNDNATLAQAMEKLAAHEAIGPDVVPAGFLEGKSAHNASGGILVDSLDEAKHAVDWYAQHGYPQIKIYNSFKPEWVAETTAYAHQRGLRVSGHVPAFMKAADAMKNGYDEIQHINQVLLNFFVKPDTDTRTLARFTLVADHAGSLDQNGKPFKDFVKLLVQKKTVLDPTLAVFEGQFTQKNGELGASYAAVAEHLPINLKRSLYKAESELTEENTARWRKSYAAMVEAVGRFHRAGIPLVAGTDGFAGFTLQRELELYVKAGIPPAEVLRIATWNGARYSRRLVDRGSIEPGKRADLILVEGDPTRNISDLRKVALVLQNGDAYYPDELYRELGVKPFAASAKVEALASPEAPAGASKSAGEGDGMRLIAWPPRGH